MRLKLVDVIEGPGPEEMLVTIPTAEGRREEVVLDRSLVRDRTIEVAKIGEREGRTLVELPRETMSGAWRVWIDPDCVAAA